MRCLTFFVDYDRRFLSAIVIKIGEEIVAYLALLNSEIYKTEAWADPKEQILRRLVLTIAFFSHESCFYKRLTRLPREFASGQSHASQL